MAGPAYCAAAAPVSTKIPAPMMAPMPSVIRLVAPKARFSECSPCSADSSRIISSGLVASKLDIRAFLLEPYAEAFVVRSDHR